MVPDPLFVLIVAFRILSADMPSNFTGWISSGVSIRRTLSCVSLSSGCFYFNEFKVSLLVSKIPCCICILDVYWEFDGIIHISFMHKPCKFVWCFYNNPRRWDSFQRGNSFKLPYFHNSNILFWWSFACDDFDGFYSNKFCIIISF